MAHKNVNISIFYRLAIKKKRERKPGFPYLPYWHTHRLRFTAIFSDFAYRGQACVCAYIIGQGKKNEEERGGRTHRRPFFSSAIRIAASPFTFSTPIHIYTAIADLLESSIYRGTASAGTKRAGVCGTYTPSFGTNCHN